MGIETKTAVTIFAGAFADLELAESFVAAFGASDSYFS
jgi:hypothetical protein